MIKNLYAAIRAHPRKFLERDIAKIVSASACPILPASILSHPASILSHPSSACPILLVPEHVMVGQGKGGMPAVRHHCDDGCGTRSAREGLVPDRYAAYATPASITGYRGVKFVPCQRGHVCAMSQPVWTTSCTRIAAASTGASN